MLNTLHISYDLHDHGDESAVLEYLRSAARGTDSFYVWTTSQTPRDVVSSLRQITADRITVFVFNANKADDCDSFALPKTNERVRRELGKLTLAALGGPLPGLNWLGLPR